jgi:hypothetical protein
LRLFGAYPLFACSNVGNGLAEGSLHTSDFGLIF